MTISFSTRSNDTIIEHILLKTLNMNCSDCWLCAFWLPDLTRQFEWTMIRVFDNIIGSTTAATADNEKATLSPPYSIYPRSQSLVEARVKEKRRDLPFNYNTVERGQQLARTDYGDSRKSLGNAMVLYNQETFGREGINI